MIRPILHCQPPIPSPLAKYLFCRTSIKEPVWPFRRGAAHTSPPRTPHSSHGMPLFRLCPPHPPARPPTQCIQPASYELSMSACVERCCSITRLGMAATAPSDTIQPSSGHYSAWPDEAGAGDRNGGGAERPRGRGIPLRSSWSACRCGARTALQAGPGPNHPCGGGSGGGDGGSGGRQGSVLW